MAVSVFAKSSLTWASLVIGLTVFTLMEAAELSFCLLAEKKALRREEKHNIEEEQIN